MFRKNNNESIKTITEIPGYTNWIRQGIATSKTEAYYASAWAMRAIKIRANAISEAKLCLYTKDGEKINSHPILDVLENSEWDTARYWRDTESGLMVYGAGFWEKERNSAGRVRRFGYINPSTMSLDIRANGIYQFIHNPVNGGVVYFNPNDIVYFMGEYNPNNDLQGYSPLHWAMIAAVGEQNADIYLNAFFKNGATPDLIISDEEPMPPPAELERQVGMWERLFGGANKQHKTAFVYGKKTIHKVGSDIKDLALDSVRLEMHRTISTALGVPELLIASVAATDITPVEMAYKIFYNQTVIPQWKMYESVLNKQLLTEFPDLVLQGAYLEFDSSDVKALNKDESETAERLIGLVEKGIIKPATAALELGYSLDDVPEEKTPEVTPAVIQPATETTTETVTDIPSDVPTKATFEEELRRYETKAIKAIKAGKSAVVNFDSEVIPQSELERLGRLLAECNTADEVKNIFSEKAQPKDLDKLIASMEKLAYEIKSISDTGTE